MYRPEPDGVGAPHGGAGDHDTVLLQRVVGVDGGSGGVTGGTHTGLIPITDQ